MMKFRHTATIDRLAMDNRNQARRDVRKAEREARLAERETMGPRVKQGGMEGPRGLPGLNAVPGRETEMPTPRSTGALAPTGLGPNPAPNGGMPRGNGPRPMAAPTGTPRGR